jgi:hypothetical protein
MRKFLLLVGLALALCASAVPAASADPTNHFTESFAINCGGDVYVIVSKPGASQVLTLNGAPSNAVSVLFRLVNTGTSGTTTLVDKPLPKNEKVLVCTTEGLAPGDTLTAWTLITSA